METNNERYELTYTTPIAWTPTSEADAETQADLAAEKARQWARQGGYFMVVVEWVNRGHTNLTVRMTAEK